MRVKNAAISSPPFPPPLSDDDDPKGAWMNLGMRAANNRLAAPRHQWHASRMTSKCIPLKAAWWRSS